MISRNADASGDILPVVSQGELATGTEAAAIIERAQELLKEGRTAEALQEMSEAFDLMLGLLRETEEGNRQIVGQVESLNANKNSIMESVESLSSVSEENAASTQETSASLSMLDTNMISVVENAENLKQIAEELRDNVAMFTI